MPSTALLSPSLRFRGVRAFAWLAGFGLWLLVTDATSASDPPLHRRIDAAVAAAAVGPLAPRCDDVDFVRRVYLDLSGVIPTSRQVRDFLADDAEDKRQRLIDTLLESPEFSRHFAVQLTTALLDRRNETTVSQQQWESYLIESLIRRKPLDQLFRELIFPESLGDAPHPAGKFLLSSSAEPHAMTRDVGRILFGMDLQCAQCHDHPLVENYLQEDYFGLFAFLHRTSLFEDKSNKVTTLSEKADGQAAYESVFTGDGRQITRPRLPKGESVYREPEILDEDEAYLVKPDKTHAGRPKHSRRRLLSERLPDDIQFRRNLANRLWALVMGRGLVHPIDFHHRDNPPIHPELLSMLADDLATNDFDLRSSIRQLVLSQTYQRSCEAPAADTLNLADVTARLESLRRQHEGIIDDVERFKSVVTSATEAWREALDANDELERRLPKLDVALAEAEALLGEATTQRDQAAVNWKQLLARSQTLQAVLESTVEAIGRFDDESALIESKVMLEARVDELSAGMTAAKSRLDQLETEWKTAQQTTGEARDRRQKLLATRVDESLLAELEQAHLRATAQWTQADARLRMTEGQIKLAEQIIDYPGLVEETADAAAAHWDSIVEQWTLRGQLTPLKPLSPEQLAASVMQASGMLAPAEHAAHTKIEEKPPESLQGDGIDESERAIRREVAVQSELLNQLRGNLNQFVSQFGGRSGEEFQATVNQALFLGNGPLNNWVASGGNSLVARLKDVTEGDRLAEELTLAVLSRLPTPEEQKLLTEWMAPEEKDVTLERPAAMTQWVWAMLASNEFRFNH